MDSHIRIGVIIRVNQQTNLIPHTEEKIMWLLFAFASSLFAALTSILAKIGIEGVNSNLATALRTMVVVIMAWGMVFLTHTQSGLFSITGRNCKHIEKELDFPYPVRHSHRHLLALLLQGITDWGGIKGGPY